jgi:hypothetical protein
MKSVPYPPVSIPYNNHDFPPGSLPNGPDILQAWPEEILWAAVTVGRANFLDVLAHGQYSKYELIYRVSMILANLTQTRAGRLTKSPAFRHLDPSEKGAVSYFLGMSLCKLFADRLLNVPWLLHFDVYQQLIGATLVSGSRMKPDLIGWGGGNDWAVLESKGRTNGFSLASLNAGKQQTRTIRSIAGNLPRWRIASVTHFSGGILGFDWADPDDFEKESFDISFTTGDFLLRYYRLVYNILNTNNEQTIKTRNYLFYSFEHFGFTVGLRRDIFTAYSRQTLSNIQRGEMLRLQSVPEISNQTFYFGADGIAVGIDPTVRRQLLD